MNICKDHQRCIETALGVAEAICAKKHLRFTPLRRKVLELVLASHRPSKAYDLMQQLSKGGGEPAKPPTVYRTLDFLLEHGLVHKLRSQDAYIACTHAGQEHGCHFLICKQCGEVTECCTNDVATLLAGIASEQDFVLQRSVVEMEGLCARCQSRETYRGRTH